MFCTRKFYKQGLFSYINESHTSFLDCKHKHMLQETELHLINLVPCTVCYIIEFQGFNSRSDVVIRLWLMVLTLFFRDGMGPDKIIYTIYTIFHSSLPNAFNSVYALFYEAGSMI